MAGVAGKGELSHSEENLVFVAALKLRELSGAEKRGDRPRCPFVKLLELMDCSLVLFVYRKTRL